MKLSRKDLVQIISEEIHAVTESLSSKHVEKSVKPVLPKKNQEGMSRNAIYAERILGSSLLEVCSCLVGNDTTPPRLQARVKAPDQPTGFQMIGLDPGAEPYLIMMADELEEKEK
jgi:hypothetical protein